MSRIIGTGLDALLVAGGADAPEAAHRDAAAKAIVRAYWILGTPGPRGWSTATWAALKALHPRAAEHYDQYEDWRLTFETFWPEDVE